MIFKLGSTGHKGSWHSSCEERAGWDLQVPAPTRAISFLSYLCLGAWINFHL